jgi:hypothetical protein
MQKQILKYGMLKSLTIAGFIPLSIHVHCNNINFTAQSLVFLYSLNNAYGIADYHPIDPFCHDLHIFENVLKIVH